MDYEIKFTKHIKDQRTIGYNRDNDISSTEMYNIMDICFKQGLSSFRNKGEVVVSFLDDNEKAQYNILLILSDNVVTIISVYYDPLKTYKAFIKVNNRIQLYRHYKLPQISKYEYQLEEHREVRKVHQGKLKHNPLKIIKRKNIKRPKIALEDIDISDDPFFQKAMKSVKRK